jgi:hypothetical protein
LASKGKYHLGNDVSIEVRAHQDNIKEKTQRSLNESKRNSKKQRTSTLTHFVNIKTNLDTHDRTMQGVQGEHYIPNAPNYKGLSAGEMKVLLRFNLKNGDRLATKKAELDQQFIRWCHLIRTDDNGRAALEFANGDVVENEPIEQWEEFTL